MDLGDESDIKKSIGAEMQRMRNESGLTQGDLAEKLGVCSRSIRNYEKGARDTRGVALWRFHALFGDVPFVPLENGTDEEREIIVEDKGHALNRWFSDFRRHRAQSRRVRNQAAMSDRWRTFRDYILLCACSFNIMKVVFTLYADFGFGITDTLADPLFFVSIIVMAARFYAFLEDLVRGRYFQDATADTQPEVG